MRIFYIGTPHMVVIVTFFSTLWNIFNEFLILKQPACSVGVTRLHWRVLYVM